MEQPTASSNTSSRSGGRASRRFTEVVSNGPTAIPPEEDVTAAISSVLAADDLGFGQPTRQPQQEIPQARTIYDARVTAPASARNGVAHAASNGPTRNTFVESGSHAGGSVNSGTHTKAADVGGGGLVDWAMWPLWTTIDALKWAGGTVNEVAVAPVIRLASPWGLGGSILTTAKAITPQRARDLARVVGNGLLNAAGLARTPAGGAFLQTSGRAAGSLSMAVSSPAGRQFLVDSATGFVKLAEALDTPEAKNAIRQGAVVVARAMDALASRDSKIFVKDLADVMVRLAELANSREATVMAAEFTANVTHALEMEHMAGIRRAATEAVAADVVYPGSTVEETGTAAETRHPAHGADGDDANVPRPLDAQEGVDTLEGLVREARLERARHEGGDVGGVRLAASTDGENDGSVRVPCEEDAGITSDRDRTSGSGGETARIDPDVDRATGTGITATELLRRGNGINPTPIRQADLTGDTPLHMLRPRTAATAGAVPAGVATSHWVASRSISATGTSADASHSAPSSPRGTHNASMAAAAAVAGVPAFGAAGSDLRSSRRRANTETGAGCRIGGRGGDGRDDETVEASPSAVNVVGVSRGSTGAGDGNGGTEVGTSGRPAVEYVRDGRAMLPRFSGETIASVLRGQPLGLELQLEAPNNSSLDDALARASRRSLEGASPRSLRMTSGSGSVARESATEAEGAAANASGEATSLSDTAVPESAGGTRTSRGWKQLVFAVALLFFAGDGLRHRWKSMSGGKSKARKARTVPIGADSASGVGIHGGRIEHGGGGNGDDEHRFRAAFLPPTCQDPVTGAVMAVWATPSGPCLLPAEMFGDTTDGSTGGWFGGGGGGGGPGCAASFRLCSVREVMEDSGADANANADTVSSDGVGEASRREADDPGGVKRGRPNAVEL